MSFRFSELKHKQTLNSRNRSNFAPAAVLYIRHLKVSVRYCTAFAVQGCDVFANFLFVIVEFGKPFSDPLVIRSSSQKAK